MNRKKSPVFIVGCPRSGTSLLHSMVYSSGGFAIYRCETHVFNQLGPKFGYLASRPDREAFLHEWLSSEYFLRSGLDEEYLRGKVLDECRSPGDFLRLLMDGIAAQQGASRWSDGTPDYLACMGDIKKSFPDALFVHITRDGRDVALSLEKCRWIRSFPWDRNRNAFAAAVFWAWTVRRGRTLGRALGSDYLEVRFEQLVTAPHATLARIAAFIDHDLDYDRILRAGVGSVSEPNTAFGCSQSGGNFAPVGRWKQGYKPEELSGIEGVIGNELAVCGYELTSSKGNAAGNASSRILNWMYCTRFGFRSWLKQRTPLARLLTNTKWLYDIASGEEFEAADPTLRPGRNLEMVRSVVNPKRDFLKAAARIPGGGR